MALTKLMLRKEKTCVPEIVRWAAQSLQKYDIAIIQDVHIIVHCGAAYRSDACELYQLPQDLDRAYDPSSTSVNRDLATHTSFILEVLQAFRGVFHTIRIPSMPPFQIFYWEQSVTPVNNQNLDNANTALDRQMPSDFYDRICNGFSPFANNRLNPDRLQAKHMRDPRAELRAHREKRERLAATEGIKNGQIGKLKKRKIPGSKDRRARSADRSAQDVRCSSHIGTGKIARSQAQHTAKEKQIKALQHKVEELQDLLMAATSHSVDKQ